MNEAILNNSKTFKYWLNKLSNPNRNGFFNDISQQDWNDTNRLSAVYDFSTELSGEFRQLAKGKKFNYYKLGLCNLSILFGKYTNLPNLFFVSSSFNITELESMPSSVLFSKIPFLPKNKARELLKNIHTELERNISHQDYDYGFFAEEYICKSSRFQSAFKVGFVIDGFNANHPDLNRCDLLFKIIQDEDLFKLEIAYANHYEKELIDLIAGHFMSSLKMICHDLEIPIFKIDLLKEPQSEQIFQYFNATRTDFVTADRSETLAAGYPLSPSQNGIFILQHFDENLTAYNVLFHLPLQQSYTIDTIQQAILELMQRHESLRTTFEVRNNEFIQIVHKDVKVEVEEIANVEFGKALKNFMRPFDLSTLPLFRVGYLKNEGEQFLLFDAHHIILDGKSREILGYELLTLLEGGELPPVKLQYKDYINWMYAEDQQTKFQKQENYWKEIFAEEVPLLELPLDFSRPKVQQFEGGDARFTLSAEQVATINELAVKNGTTNYIVLLAVWTVFLSKVSNENDITVGTPVAGRRHPDLEGVVGMFVNTLPLRNRPQGEKLFSEFIAEVKTTFINGFENQEYPFDKIVEKVVTVKTSDRNPLFDTMFSLLESEVEDTVELDKSPEIQFTNDEEIAKFDLDLTAIDGNNHISFNLNYNTSLFLPSTIHQFVEFFREIINCLGNGDLQLGEINILSEEQQFQLIDGFNKEDEDRLLAENVVELFRKQISEKTDHAALLIGNDEYTYLELEERSNQLAHYLTKKGVAQGDLVAVCIERSVEMIVGMLAIIKTGAAYVPIDPEYPTQRINYIFNNAKTKVVISSKSCKGLLKDWKNVEAVLIDEEWPAIAGEEKTFETPVYGKEDLAYIIYTSGSTGHPKGVMITHGNLSAFLGWCLEEFAHDNFELVYGVTSICFDLSIYEIFYTLSAGKQLRLLSNGLAIGEALKEDKNVLLNTVPGVIRQLLLDEVDLSPVNVINMAGEPIPAMVKNRLDLRRIKVRNLYGPSEDTTYSTIFHLTDDQPILIGQPLANTKAYLLDEALLPVPIGVAGQLYLSGHGLSKGYLHRPKLTAEKFIDNPYGKGPHTRMYATGDLAKWTSDGNLDFVGRADSQVKVRGYRIELGEIEKKLQEVAAVNQCVVLAKEIQGSTQLVAYVVVDSSFDRQVVKEQLRKELPDYMIPEIMMELEAFPQTPNGKINKKGLPDPNVQELVSMPYVAPQNEQEGTLVEIWKEILRIEQIGVNDNFFELGGHSLLAVKITNQIAQQMTARLTLRAFFEGPTVRQIAARIEKGEQVVYENIPVAPVLDTYPLSPAQNRMFILQHFDEQIVAYNMPYHAPLESSLTIEEIKDAVDQLVERHESLRTTFEIQNNDFVQIIHPKVDFEIELFQEVGINEAMGAFVRPFKLNEAPLFRVGYLKQEDEVHLLLDIHHIISDGASQDLLGFELLSILQGEELPPLRLQYKDYAYWVSGIDQLDTLLQQQEYWLNTFATPQPFINIPTDYPRPDIQSFEGKSATFSLSSKESRILNQLTRQHGITSYSILLSAWATLLAKLSSQEDITIGTPVSGRNHPDLANVVGMFVNTLPIRSYPEGDKLFVDFAKEVQQNFTEAYDNQMYPFEKLVEEVWDKKITGRNPLFDTMFAWVEGESDDNETDERAASEVRFDETEGIAKFDLHLTGFDNDGHIGFDLTYSTRLFTQQTIAGFIQYFRRIIESLEINYTRPIAQIDILSVEERHQLLEDFNPVEDVVSAENVIELFTRQALAKSQEIAIIAGEQSLSYEELDHRSNQLAHHLNNKGAKAGDLIAICMERSAEMLVGMLAIIKVGAAYVPIDPAYPTDRINYIFNDAQTKIVLSNSDSQSLLDNRTAVEAILLDEEWETIAQESKVWNNPPLSKEDLAYIIYTSGSTGNPKGVMITHGNLSAFLHWCLDEFKQDDFEVVYGVTSICFDLSVYEIFFTLCAGKRLKLLASGLSISEALKEDRKVLINTVPGVVRQLLLEEADLSQVKVLNMAGEPIPAMVKERLDLNRMKVRNLYGPSEDTTYSTIFELTDEQPILIGRPISNTQMYILDKHLQPVPVDVVGQLYISGHGLAKGYLNQTELTNEKFISNPYGQGAYARMYATGDLARWTANGNIDFLGRADSQVKVRGYRIELGEIEKVLQAVPGITQCVVLAREIQESKQLVAYVIAESPVDKQQVKEVMKKKLPDYMIPEIMMELEAFPQTPNGKIDRKALPNPNVLELVSAAYVDPQTDEEVKLAEIWKEILGLEQVGVQDNFFELGGHSLLAVKIINQIALAFDARISLREFFGNLTINEQLLVIAENESAYRPIEPAPALENYPMSPAQKRMFILQEFDEDTITYNVPLSIPVPKEYTEEKIKEVITQLADRHESLRTSFEIKDGEFVQLIHDQVAFDIQTFVDADLDEVMGAFVQPFQLNQLPLFRVGLLNNGDAKTLLFDLHHIITDETSQGILGEELQTILEGNHLPEIKLQYKDFAYWLASEEQKARIEKQEQYWLNIFAEEVPLLDLPLDFSRPATQTFEGSDVSFYLSPEESQRLNALAARYDQTLYTFLLSLWSVFISKISNEEDVTIGTPVAGRSHPDLVNMVGMFVNTLAIRTEARADITLEQFLAKVKEQFINAFDHQDYPFEKIVEKVWNSQTIARNPIFDTMFGFVDMAGQETENQYDAGSPMFSEEEGITKFDLHLTAINHGQQLGFNLTFNTNLFLPATINKLIGYFREMIASIDQGQTLLGDINILPEKEEKQLNAFTRGEAMEELHTTVVELFIKQAQETPEAVALEFEGTKMTYQELDAQSTRLANHLASKGVQAESLVGVCLERSFEMMIGLLGILKSGGAYVPIDPQYPKDRIDYILEDTQANWVLINNSEYHLFEADDQLEIIVLNGADSSWKEASDENLLPMPDAAQLMYVIYTSGSTGRPKGVMNQYDGVVNRLRWGQSTYRLHAGQDAVLQKTTFCFDVSVWELFWPLISGARLVLARPGGQKDSEYLKTLIAESKISIIHFVPSMLEVFLMDVAQGDCKNLRAVFCSGEALKLTQVKLFRERIGSVPLYNLYGPTEAAIEVSHWTVPVDASFIECVPIGKPTGNTQLYILDKSGHQVPVGITGELHIGGVQVARGYLNRPALTEERFIRDPFNISEGAKLYKTGDLARWLPDGNIEYLGRIDAQVKIRGYRIELGEIEAVLQAGEHVRNAVVLAKDNLQGGARIVAYVVPEGSFEKDLIIADLKNQLPEYMVPALMMEIDEIPLTPNGKLDRKSLPNPDASSLLTNEYIPARSETEKIVADIWKEMLEVEQVGMLDNFFDLGGHSLLAVKITHQVTHQLEVKLSLREFFEHPTPELLAERIEKGEKAAYTSIPAAPKLDHYPLSPAQNRMFILQHFDKESVAYNIPSTMPVEDSYTKKHIAEALAKLIGRHESLRTSFDFVDHEPVQMVHEDVDLIVDTFKNISLDEVMPQFVRPFNLSEPPLFRVGYVKNKTGSYLLVDLHHIITDGASQEILGQELMDLLAGEQLEETTLQYKDYAYWLSQEEQQQKLEEQQKYWLKVFEEKTPTLEIPIDYPRDTTQRFEGGEAHFNLTKEEIEILRGIATAHRQTVYTVLFSIWTILLSKISNEEDVTVGTPVVGRSHPDLSNVVGMFVNTLAVRNYPNGRKTFSNYLREVGKHFLKAFDNQDYPLEKLVEEVWDGRVRNRNPLFDTMFVWTDNREAAAELLPDFKEEISFSEKMTVTKFDLNLRGVDLGDRLGFNLSFSRNLFKQETIAKFITYFRQIIGSLKENPGIQLKDISLLSAKEEQLLLHDFNQSEFKYPKEKTLVDLWTDSVDAHASHLALSHENAEMTYRQLDEESSQLANCLVSDYASSNKLVCICLDRSMEMISGILAILKAGHAYVPIEPDFPAQRIDYILGDTQADLVLTTSEHKALFADYDQLNLLVIDEVDLTTQPTSLPEVKITPDDLAYLIYTSGSTGRPKGVQIEHHSIVENLLYYSSTLDIRNTDNQLLLAGYVFDASVEQLFAPLISGACLSLITKERMLYPGTLEEEIEKKGITHIHATPTLLKLVKPKRYSKLRSVCSGGEICTLTFAASWAPFVTFWNKYGPTETTVSSTYHAYELGRDYSSSLPIGKPSGNTTLYILDQYRNLLPPGAIGELYIGGNGLSRGYLNQEALTEAQFVDSPFIEGEKLYKTGDLARWLSDGNLEFKGRKDDQIKIRGQRMELGEVENVLNSCPEVAQSAVIAVEDHTGQKRLAAFVVSVSDFNLEQIQVYMNNHLPGYMVPSIFQQVAELPMTATGKINRRALPVPDFADLRSKSYTAPESATEKELVATWEVLLGLNSVGINENFFEIGGHSILAMRLISLMREKYKFNLSIKDLIGNPTIEELAAMVDSGVLNRGLIMPVNKIIEGQQAIFLVPPILGSSIIYKPIGSYLQQLNYNCYGLQYRGFDYDEAFDSSIEKMAESFYAEMKDLLPEKGGDEAVKIMGYSMGAAVAYHLVHLLETDGYTCKLILLDRGVSTRKTLRQDRMRRWIHDSESEHVDRLVNQHMGEIRMNIMPEENERIRELITHNMELLRKYVMKTSIKADILAIEAEESNFKCKMKDWNEFTEGKLFHRYILTDHFGMITNKVLPDVIKLISSFLHEPEKLKAYEGGFEMNFFNLFHNRSKFFFVYLGLLGVINGVWASALLLLINNKVTDTPLPYFDDYDWVVYVVLIVVSFAIAASFQSYMIRLTYTFGNELGLSIYNKIRFTSFEDFKKLGEERIRTAMNDVGVLQRFPNSFLESFNAFVMVVIGIIYLFYVNAFGAVFVSVMMVVLAAIYLFRNAKIEAYLDKARDLGNVYHQNVVDFIRGFKEVKMSIKRSDNIFLKFITKNRNNFVNLQIKALIRALGNELIGSYAWYLMIGIVLFILPALFDISLQVKTNFLITLLFLMGPVNVVIGIMDEYIRMNIAISRLNKFNEIVNSTVSVEKGHGNLTNINENFSQLTFEGITFEYLDQKKSSSFKLGPINLEFKKGESIFVTGGNGSGKSTFINILSGLLIPQGGKIMLNGHEITEENAPFYRDQLACIFTDNYLFSENYDGLDLTRSNKRFMALLKKMKLINVVSFDEDNNKVYHNLSKGQQKRMALIYALLEDKDIFVFDEWAAEQDPEFRKYFYTTIIPELKQMGKTVIAVTHDDAYFNCAERLIKFDFGQVVRDEPVEK